MTSCYFAKRSQTAGPLPVVVLSLILALLMTRPESAGAAPGVSGAPGAPEVPGAPGARVDINNFRLNYSTAGYGSRGTKMVLIRTLTAINPADVSVTDSQWALKSAISVATAPAPGAAAPAPAPGAQAPTPAASVATGKITYFGTTYGIQYWVADFSSFTAEGAYVMEVTLRQNANSGGVIGVKQTLPFTVQKDNFSKTILIPLSLNNADARKAAAGRTGFYDATSAAFQEAYSHGIFLYGLLQMYKYKYESLNPADKARLTTDINIAVDHLLSRWSPDATTLFGHPETGAKTRGGMNDIEPFFALALYIDMFKTIDPARANDALFQKLTVAFNMLKTAPAGWQDTGYQQYKDYLIPAAVHMYRYSGDVAWKNEAITRLNSFLSTFSLRSHYRGSARGIPLFDGLRLCAQEFPDDPNYGAWIKQAQTIKETDYKSSKIWSENVFHIITTSAARDPAKDWDSGRLTADMWGALEIGYSAGAYVNDALILARLTRDPSLEKIAAGEIYWDMGLNPGIPAASITNPPSTTDRESAAFILNAPFRHVTGVTYRDFKMRNDTYMTLVNGFNANGGANQFLYVGTISYNGEDFIKHDGSLILGALMYEDYLGSKK